MLLDHGWLPDEVDKWHDPAGACWHVDYACPFAVGRPWEALAESIAREQWRRVGESLVSLRSLLALPRVLISLRLKGCWNKRSSQR